jgi:hypothetical protein
MVSLVGISIIASITGCDRNSKALVPQPSDQFPGVIEIGELAVLPPQIFSIYNRQEEKQLRGAMSAENLDIPLDAFGPLPSAAEAVPEIKRGACDFDNLIATLNDYYSDEREVVDLNLDGEIDDTEIDVFIMKLGDYLQRLYGEDGRARVPCYFGQLGQSELGTQGGATYTFTAPVDTDAGEICLIVDPETVFWSQSIAPVDRVDEYAYPDFYNDDGDIDMFAGLSSYYNGSPGQELGDFTGFYTDSLGTTVEIEYGECFQTGYPSGMNTAHAGRGTVEYCSIDVAQRATIEYTVVLETFNVPLDDGVLSFGAAAIDGRCVRLGPSECTVRGESLTGTGDNIEPRYCTDKLEDASCSNNLGAFCCANPEMCGNPPTEPLCDDGIFQFEEDQVSGPGSPRDKWCCMQGMTYGWDLCCDIEATDEEGGASDQCKTALGMD